MITLLAGTHRMATSSHFNVASHFDALVLIDGRRSSDKLLLAPLAIAGDLVQPSMLGFHVAGIVGVVAGQVPMRRVLALGAIMRPRGFARRGATLSRV